MPYRHNEEWRMRIVLTVAWQESQPMEKVTREGEHFSCFVHHLDGEGLIQISRVSPQKEGERFYRFDKFGGLQGVFDHSATGEEALVYDRRSGVGRGKRHEIEVECSAMMGRLELILTEEEHLAYWM